MTASRYAVSARISNEIMLRADDAERYLEHIKRSMRGKLGDELVQVLEDFQKPVTVRLTWQEKSYPLVLEGFEIALIADIEPVEVMHIIIPEMHFTYTAFREGAPIPVEWQCGYCGQTNLIDNLDCRKCGAPRKPLR